MQKLRSMFTNWKNLLLVNILAFDLLLVGGNLNEKDNEFLSGENLF